MINKLVPYSNNQVPNNKPNTPRSYNTLMGHIGGSFNGGIDKTIHFKQCMAGERFKEYRIQVKMRMLTPLTPSYNNLKCCVKTYYVPNSRVWKNAETYTSQKYNGTETKIEMIPNFEGKEIPGVYFSDSDEGISLMHTDVWRDAYISSYIPRMGRAEIEENVQGAQNIYKIIMPKMSALPLRGRIAIYNDFLRSKKYDPEIQEYDTDNVSAAEWASYLPMYQDDTELNDIKIGRAQRPNSYYTDYRTEMQGFEYEDGMEVLDGTSVAYNEQLVSWASWESKIAEARSEAEDGAAGLNDWDIIAKIRGSKKLSEGKVQLIGVQTFNLNYAAVTQNAYNNSDSVQDVRFKTLGQQGAYSYTEIDLPCFAGYETAEEGYIHVIATVYAESVFCTGIDRLELNVTPLEQYRPDLKDDKLDTIYNCEFGTTKILEDQIENNSPYNAVGFKRKFSEYFKLGTCINGDICNQPYIQIEKQGQNDVENGTLIPQNTYQLYEDDSADIIDTFTNQIIRKKPWKDCTDLLINKNLAIRQEVEQTAGNNYYRVTGYNQIDYIGIAYCHVDMPIDEAIKKNYTTWGEH